MTRHARLLLSMLLLTVPSPLFASDEPEHPKGMAHDDVAITGSAASFDRRLPPVIPGEEIKHNGRKTRVWSTSGPLETGAVPVPPNAPQLPNNYPNQLPAGVIVDQRDGYRADRK